MNYFLPEPLRNALLEYMEAREYVRELWAGGELTYHANAESKMAGALRDLKPLRDVGPAVKQSFHDIRATIKTMAAASGNGYVGARDFSTRTGLCLNADCLRCSLVMYQGKREVGNARCGETRMWVRK